MSILDKRNRRVTSCNNINEGFHEQHAGCSQERSHQQVLYNVQNGTSISTEMEGEESRTQQDRARNDYRYNQSNFTRSKNCNVCLIFTAAIALLTPTVLSSYILWQNHKVLKSLCTNNDKGKVL